MRKTVLIFLCINLIACSARPNAVKPNPEVSEALDDDIYIVNHGWHTGVVIPAKHLFSRLPGLNKRFAGTKYLEIGWGDSGFYRANEITTGITLRAMFWPTDAVVHVVAMEQKAPLEFALSESAKICIDDVEFASLLQFLINSFARDDNDKLVSLGEGIYGNSEFYRAVGEYYLVNTCNKWTAKALESAGMDIWPTTKLTASSIMSYLDDSSKLQQCKQY